jgi:hypothetical protein
VIQAELSKNKKEVAMGGNEHCPGSEVLKAVYTGAEASWSFYILLVPHYSLSQNLFRLRPGNQDFL